MHDTNQNSRDFFSPFRYWQVYSECYRSAKPRNVKTVLKEKNKFGGVIFSDFKITEINILQFWHKNNHTEQWDLTDSQETDFKTMFN